METESHNYSWRSHPIKNKKKPVKRAWAWDVSLVESVKNVTHYGVHNKRGSFQLCRTCEQAKMHSCAEHFSAGPEVCYDSCCWHNLHPIFFWSSLMVANCFQTSVFSPDIVRPPTSEREWLGSATAITQMGYQTNNKHIYWGQGRKLHTDDSSQSGFPCKKNRCITYRLFFPEAKHCCAVSLIQHPQPPNGTPRCYTQTIIDHSTIKDIN